LTLILYLWLIILLVGGDIPVNSEALLVTAFINLKIKSLSLSNIFIVIGCACVFIEMSVYTCMSNYVYTVFLKKIV
jgi:hypothetical protein